MNSILDTIGNTPLIELKNIYQGKGRLFCKLENFNPGGSIKDRAALQIIKDAYKEGKLKKGQTVVEMTSGNLGAGLAIVCKAFENPFIAVISEGNSPERRKMIEAFGGKVILTPQVDGEPGKVTNKDIHIAKMMAEETTMYYNAFYTDQFNNVSSIRAHYLTTGPEIFTEMNKNIDVFISVIGSGGTFIGISTFLKHEDSHIRCIAVEPENASVIKTGEIKNTKHIIQGTGYGIVPKSWDHNKCDNIITVSDEEVIKTTQDLACMEGIYAGYSSGANVLASIKYLNNINSEINVVTIICDTAYKYSDL